MKYISFRKPDGRTGFGRTDGNEVVELGRGGAVTDLRSALERGALHELLAGDSFKLSELVLLPPIPNPGKILCVGLNYESHRMETGRAEAAHPAIFTRFADTLVAHGEALVRPKVSSEFDYEGELAVVIGKGGRAICKDAALSHVAGYACFNDASVRDWQRHNIQFTPGKNFPGTGGFGPWMTTPDEVGDPAARSVVTRLNGQIVQNQSVSEMIWPVAEIIAYLSAFTPLAPGDVIATGTPGGVGSKRVPPLWLKAGDSVSVAIEGVGLLVNHVIAEE
jgi:2-keto-4-pentenoate hydratase/2-oxohepta-3-ene-1,7-dioic acid hydratase in catechol pathway